jgi:hypothetical protein
MVSLSLESYNYNHSIRIPHTFPGPWSKDAAEAFALPPAPTLPLPYAVEVGRTKGVVSDVVVDARLDDDIGLDPDLPGFLVVVVDTPPPPPSSSSTSPVDFLVWWLELGCIIIKNKTDGNNSNAPYCHHHDAV